MFEIGLLILYADDPRASACLHHDFQTDGPIEVSPTFAMIRLWEWLRLGFRSRRKGSPPTQATGGADRRCPHGIDAAT